MPHHTGSQRHLQLNRDFVRPLIDLNKGPRQTYPRIIIRFNEQVDLTALADNLTKIVPLGTPIPVKWVLDKFGVPEARGGEAMLAVGAAATPNVATATPDGAPASKRSAHAADMGSTTPDPDSADLQTARLEQDAGPLFQPVITHLERLVKDAQSLEQLRDDLLSSYGHLPMVDLTKLMSQAFTSAHAAGMVDVVNGD